MTNLSKLMRRSCGTQSVSVSAQSPSRTRRRNVGEERPGISPKSICMQVGLITSLTRIQKHFWPEENADDSHFRICTRAHESREAALHCCDRKH